MVSHEFSKESTSSALRQCLISDMDACPVHSEDTCYGLQFQSNSIPLCFQPLGEQISRREDAGMDTRGLKNGGSQKENIPQGFSYRHGHGLSLTLGSRLTSDFKDREANAMCSNYLSDDYIICEGAVGNNVYNASNPSSTASHGMTSIIDALQNSPYLKPAQQLLDEVVCVSNAVELNPDKLSTRSSGMAVRNGGRSLPLGESANQHDINHCSSEENHEVHIKISKLVALLDALENRYEHYFHQMDEVVSSFEVVAGIGAAASYTALTIQAMSKHFSNLRDAIVTQLNAWRGSLSETQSRSHGDASHQKLNTRQKNKLQHLGMIQARQVWRPLRGLPEDSVALLRAWLFEHFLHPYPSDNEKLMLASQTGLTRNQISNWFINARVRLWKPMIEEMYRQEFSEDLQDIDPS